MTQVSSELLHRTKAIEPWTVEIRRRLHQVPELLYELHETQAIVCDELSKLKIPFESGVAETGVVATIGSNRSRCIALRADMDALPIEEQADVDFPSRNRGAMHACGHDAHTAMLLSAARILKESEASLPGTVKLIFQPAEEGGAGAKRMCAEGVMENPRVERIFGLHVWPTLPTGQLTGRSGTFLAAMHQFRLTVVGKGGHAAIPNHAIDPIVTAAKIVTEIQTIISREQNPLNPGVISCTAIEGGSAYNVIPEQVEIKGTIRALTLRTLESLKQRLAEVAIAIGQANRCQVEIEGVGEDYPETLNDAELWDEVTAMGKRLVGGEHVSTCEPTMGGEDFAFYSHQVPGCFMGLGTRNEATGCTYGLHHPKFKVDESALHIGAALHVAFALEQLGA